MHNYITIRKGLAQKWDNRILFGKQEKYRKQMFFRMIIAAVVNVLMFRSVGMIERMTVTGDWTIILLLAKKRRSLILAVPFTYTRWQRLFCLHADSRCKHTHSHPHIRMHIPFGLSQRASQGFHVTTNTSSLADLKAKQTTIGGRFSSPIALFPWTIYGVPLILTYALTP